MGHCTVGPKDGAERVTTGDKFSIRNRAVGHFSTLNRTVDETKFINNEILARSSVCQSRSANA